MNEQEEKFYKEYQYVLDEMQAGDSWRLFRIMSEFVDGFDLLSRQEPMVSVFGSARAKEDDVYARQAADLGAKLAKVGIAVITGGGPGIMEAANKGAQEAGGKSIGIGIDLPLEQPVNRFTNQSITVRHFFVRKVMLIKYSQAFVIFPGGYGTLDETFEALNLMRTKMILPFPVILVGKKYWKNLLEWLKKSVMGSGCIDQGDLNAIHITDSLDEVVSVCQKSIVESTKSQWIMKGRR